MRRAAHALFRRAHGALRRVPLRTWVLAALLAGSVALGHEQPEDEVADFVMTDWMILTGFFGFMIPALLVTLLAWRRGFFADMEGDVKTFWLTPEPDYETPPWAWEEAPDWARPPRNVERGSP